MRSFKIVLSVLICITLAAGVFFAGCTTSGKPRTNLVVPSSFTDEKMKPDGHADEKIWKKIKPAKLPTKGGPDVFMRSVHTDTDIYFLIEWADATKEDISKVWEFDGTRWKNGPDQDKLSILWDKSDSVAYFDIKGCEAVCHTEDPDADKWYMATNGRREKTDLWFWMAGIGNVYGFVNDRFLDDTIDPTLPKAARKQDRGEVGFLKNGYKAPVEKIAPTRPTKKLVEGLTVESTPYPTIDQMEDITSYRQFKPGDKEPFIYFYGPPTDSQADVFGRANWKDGKWTLEMGRKLNTGHKDDMPFFVDRSGPKFYMFGLMISDHTEPPPIKHYTSPPVSLRIDP